MNNIEPIRKSCVTQCDEKWARHKMSSSPLSTDIPATLGIEYVRLGNKTCLMAVRCALKIWYSLRELIIIYQDLNWCTLNLQKSFDYILNLVDCQFVIHEFQ